VWDEWYLSFSEGLWGWLAEAQGNLYLMFQKRLRRDSRLPEFEDLRVGTNLDLAGLPFHVMERGVAIGASAEGEIPWDFRAGAEHRFVDLQSPEGAVATLEFDDSPQLFIGKQINLEDLQLEGDGWDQPPQAISTQGLQLNCPNCGGPLTLHAPDQSLRVMCPSCNSLLDADHGKLSYLKTLKSKESFPVLIPLGREGKLFDQSYTVIGYMRRYATWNGQMFPWSEYLLYHPSAGFRWLVHNQDHWSFVEPPRVAVPPKFATTNQFTYYGDLFRLYDRGTAYVRHVLGEFYWRVEVGEQVRTADYIAPPKMLSFEWSNTGRSEELNVSLGTYVPVAEVEAAFGVTNLPRPWGVGVIQPPPWPGWGVYLLWPVFVLVLIMIHAAYSKPGTGQGSDGWLCFYSILMVSSVPLGILAFRYAFEVHRWRSSDFSPYATE
jgi:hypothetical protein